MTKKYKLTDETKVVLGRTLYRIQAITSFSNVEEGERGGFVEKEANLSQEGDAWVSGNAWVYGNARVSGNAWVSGEALVSGNAWVYGNARVSGNAWVSGEALVSGNARVYGNAQVSGNARVSGNAWVSGEAQVSGNAWVSGNARVYGNAWVYGNALVKSRTEILWMTPIGSENGTLTVTRSKDGGLFINRGCFYGSLDEFTQAVKETHGDNEYGKQYQLIIELIKLRFGVEDSK